MTARSCFALSLLFGVSSHPTLAQPQSSAPSKPAACNGEKARFAIGDRYTPELAERARQAAGAHIVQKVEPGGAYTMELRPDRLNLEVDRSDIVREVSCE